MRRLALTTAVAASVALALTGCATAAPAATPTTHGPAALHGTVIVAAAASLQAAFDTSIVQFEKEYPGVQVKPSYDGSSTLATQIIGGAPVDVFASADEATMKLVTDKDLAETPVTFARNTLVIVVPKNNPGDVRDLADLANPRVTVVLCAPAVPCGAASRTLLQNQGVKVTPASDEQNVTAVLTKVRTGEADAGLVYVTDAKTTDQVQAITPKGAADVVNTYPIAVLKDAPNPAAARAFVRFVTGRAGQAILAKYGFQKP